MLTEEHRSTDVRERKELTWEFPMQSFDVVSLFELQAEKRYDADLLPAVNKRIFSEITALQKTGQLWKFWKLKEFMTITGIPPRELILYGTTAGSILLYLMDVIELDPVRYNLRQEFVFGIDDNKDLHICFGVSKDKIEAAIDYFKPERTETFDQQDGSKLELYSCHECFSFQEDKMLTDLASLPVEQKAKQNTLYTEKELMQVARQYAMTENSLDRTHWKESRYHRDLSELVEEEKIYSRDHLFRILQEHDIGKSQAWDITEYIRRGGAKYDPKHKMKKYRRILKEHDLNHNFSVVCQRARYLAPMSMCLQRADTMLTLGALRKLYDIHEELPFV